jgi:hypothetical protein
MAFSQARKNLLRYLYGTLTDWQDDILLKKMCLGRKGQGTSFCAFFSHKSPFTVLV